MLPLLLLPGMMCDARLFTPQIAAFSGQVPIMTLPIGGAERMDGIAASLLATAPPRFRLAGLSMGGIVAMEMLRQAPDRVAAIALMDTNPLAEQPEVARAREPQMAAAADGRLTDVMRDEMKPNYLAEGPAKAEILNLCMAMAETLGPDVFIRQSKALRDRRDQSETLKQFRGPALILCGAGDLLCPPSRHRLMHDLMPQSHLEIIDGAAHLPTLEKPEETNAALTRWMEE